MDPGPVVETEAESELDATSSPENIDSTSQPLADQETSFKSDNIDISKQSVSVDNQTPSDTLDDSSEQTNSKKSRELKSLLALSKEANLKTNISHKRKKDVRDSPRGHSDTDSKKSNKVAAENKHSFRFPVTAEAELEEQQEDETKIQNESNKLGKRKRDHSNESMDRSISEDSHRKNKKTLHGDVKVFKPNKDAFCWRCHREGVNVVCETCPRSYHQKCLKQTIMDANHWPCPECVAILKAESTQTRTPAMKEMTLEHLCNLLKFAVHRMIQCQGSEPFLNAVSENDFPDYRKYIIQPMDLTMLKENIKDNLYGSTQAFEADAKWLLHNSIIYNSSQSKLTSAVKTMIKICKQEMMEIENCPSCYLKANINKSTWFIEVCPKPHILVWAKLKGFPYWPAKAMSVNSVGMVDVRFFGAHDRAWVHWRECYLYSEKDPNTFKQKRYDIEKCVEELNVYIENLKQVYGEFRYAPFRTLLDPDDIYKQLIIFLPRYKSVIARRKSHLDSVESKQEETNDSIEHPKEKSERSEKFESRNNSNLTSPLPDNDVTMEGYGTDDDMQSELDLESRKAFTDKKVADGDGTDDEEDLDDTQVPSNVSADITIPRRKVRIRGGMNNSIGKLKVLPRLSIENHLPTKEGLPTPKARRNSDQNVKSDSSRLSNISDKINKNYISDKINKVFSEYKDKNLDKDDVGFASKAVKSPLNDESSRSGNEHSADVKQKPVKVDVNNVEYSLSPNKLKISDQLIKRLTDVQKVEEIKKAIAIGDDISEPSTSTCKKVEINGDSCSNQKQDDELIGSSQRQVQEKQINLKVIQPSITEYMTVRRKSCDDNNIVSQNEKNCSENVKSVKADDVEIDSTENVDEISKQQNINGLEKQIEDKKSCEDIKGNEAATSEKPSENSEKEGTFVKNVPDTTGDLPEKILETSQKIVRKEKNKPSNQNAVNIIEDFEEEEDEEDNNSESLAINKKNLFEVIHWSLKEAALNKQKGIEVAQNIEKPVQKNSGSVNTVTQSEVSKKRKLPPDEQQNLAKLVKLVSIESILNRKNEEDKPEHVEKQTEKKITENQPDVATEDIKGEPESDDEITDDTHIMEEKRKYLSALNIHEKTVELEKKEKNEIRTRSKAEEKRERFKVVDNLTRIIDDVALNYSAKHEGERLPPKKPERRKSNTSFPTQEGGIFVKSFAQLHNVLPNKQRARKTFPTPGYFKQSQKHLLLRKDVSLVRKDGQPQKLFSPNVGKPAITTNEKPLAPARTYINTIVRTSATVTHSTPSTTSTTSISAAPLASVSSQNAIDVAAPPTTLALVTQPSINLIHNQKAADSTITIPQQSMAMGHVIIMPSGSINYCSPLLSTVTQPAPALTACPLPLTQNQSIAKTSPNLRTSQNYIPHSDDGSGSSSPPTINSLNELVNQQTTTPQTPQQRVPEESETVTPSTSTGVEIAPASSENQILSAALSNKSQQEDELSVLNGLIPESVSRAVCDLLLRPPPKLKPRPPGITSQSFDEGIPSTAGDATTRINSISHRMTDYFRGMLIESLEDLGKTNNPEAKIVSLQLEIEAIKHRHSVEMSEVRKNICSILKDIQRSIIEEREKIVDQTRASCEAETIRRVEMAKSKQWCANCPKEAQFYCCWNTSYCDYPCQQKHWPQHSGKCTQSIEKATGTGAVPPARIGPQPIVLRPTGPPKPGMGRFIAKPAKVYMNRSTTPQKNVKTIPTSGLTLVETTPGNYELIGNGSIGIAGKIFTPTNSISTAKIKSTHPSTVGTAPRLSTVTTDSSRPTASTSTRPQHI